MSLSDRLKNLDAQSSVSKEFRVYTTQGAFLSVTTLLIILYLVVTELYFNFQVTLQERVHVNATSPRGLEMEFDISLPNVPCSHVSIDAADPSGQSQSLHLDKKHHVWKHRFKLSDNGKRTMLIGSKQKLELGSTLLQEEDLEETLLENIVEADERDLEAKKDECGSCYGAGEEGECCDTCDDVKRAYKRKGWVLKDTDDISQCKNQRGLSSGETSDEGCNIHGVVALSTGGGNLHLAPGQDYGAEKTGNDIMDMLLKSFQQWNVSHTVNKIRFGPEYPAAVYQLDREKRIVTDSSAMYQYYFQVRLWDGRVKASKPVSVDTHRIHSFLSHHRLFLHCIAFEMEQRSRLTSTVSLNTFDILVPGLRGGFLVSFSFMK